MVVDVLSPYGSAGIEGCAAVVVIVHGFTAHRHEANVVAIAEALRRENYAVVVGDLRGHGESGGLSTLGDQERFDVAEMVRIARTLHDRVVVIGASMGAIATLRYAADDAGLAGAVTVSCPARWQLRTLRTAVAAVVTQTAIGRRLLARRIGVRVAEKWTRSEAPEVVAARVTCPLAIVHGLADRFMPALEASRLRSRVLGPHRLDLVPAMGHAFDAIGRSTIVAAVAWCLVTSDDDDGSPTVRG